MPCDDHERRVFTYTDADVLLLTTGEPYTDRWRAEWKYLYSVGKNVSNNGAFSFVPTPMEMPLALWHMGSMRVSPSTEPDGTWYVFVLICVQFTVISSDLHPSSFILEGRIDKRISLLDRP